MANGIWGAELLNRQSFDQESLTGSGDSLYAFGNGILNRIDPASGNILQSAPYTAPVVQPPVVLGGKVWVVSAYGGGEITLRGYDTRTLARVASVQVPAIGGVAGSAQGVLAAGPGRPALRGRGREHRGGEPGLRPADPPDQPDRGPGQLGGDRAPTAARCTSASVPPIPSGC